MMTPTLFQRYPKPSTDKPETAREPWHPVDHELADERALRALREGLATTEQQRRAWDWITIRCAMTWDQSFYPTDPLVTAFIEGKRSVGLQMTKLANLKPRTETDAR